jgi:phosphatidylglycerol lysyltransferase
MSKGESNGRGGPPDADRLAPLQPPPQARAGRGGSRRQLLIGLAGFVVALAALLGLERAAAGISVHAVNAALRSTPTSALLTAVAATVVSYMMLFGYDFSGLRYAHAHPPLSSIILASFCGYGIGNAVGFGALSGGAVRYRIYAAVGLSPGQIARVMLFISAAIGVGVASMAALGFALFADRLAPLLGASPEPLVAAALSVLGLAAGFLLLCATRRRAFALGPIRIEPPGPTLVATQILVTTADLLAAAAVLWVLLPPSGIGFLAFAAVFATAIGLGMLSHIPGGLGVFDLAILYAVGDKIPVAVVTAALLAYRAIYFLLPLCLSTICLLGFETRRFFAGATGDR